MTTAAPSTALATIQPAFTDAEPHEARKDTVIFPAFRQAVPVAEIADLGQHFADLGRQFGRDEFSAMTARVAGIEQDLGIYDLSQFTPQVGPFPARRLTTDSRRSGQ